MVSPRLDNRLSGETKDIHFSKNTHRTIGDVEKTAPPTGFQFSAGNIKVCVQPKQQSRSNNVPSDSRRLGNVRASLFASGAEDVVFIRRKSESNSSNSSTKQSSSKSQNTTQRRKSNSKGNKLNSVENNPRSKNIHSVAKPEQERRRQMTTTLDTMLGRDARRKSSLRTTLDDYRQQLAKTRLSNRKNSVENSMGKFHHQQLPDAKNERYQVHKWRRKSSRRKYAGMQASPLAFESHIQSEAKRPRNVIDEPYDNAETYDNIKKPHVPLPGLNMLPALRVHDRSVNGDQDDQEITFTFARNHAMEELERRFHDDSWKSKRLRKNKSNQIGAVGSNDRESLNTLLRETRRTNVLRRVASLHMHQQSEPMHEHSAMQMLESLAESPEKNMNDFHNVSKHKTPELRINENLGDNDIPNIQQNTLLSTDAVQYKMIADSLSEETVTIISKPSEALSRTKNSVGLSHGSLETEHATADTTKHSQKLLPSIRSHPAYRPSERRFPVLPDFPKTSKTKFNDGAIVFSQLQKNMNKENEQQYGKFSRSHKSLDRVSQTIKTKEKRVLPPIRSQKQSTNDTSEKKITIRKPRAINEDTFNEIADNISPLGSSPTRKKPSRSSKTSPLSHISGGGLQVKDQSSTPADSTSSRSTGGRRKSNKWRRRSIRSDSKGSPQFYRAQRQTKLAKLMNKWKAAIRLTIMFDRLCNDHYIVTDDSYNIHFGRAAGTVAGPGTKPEVLFDVTDYKTKNQQKLSDTTRRVLSTPSEDRTEQDIRMVQTALRNVKAISDHSSSVQANIAKSGYFAGFDSKRVVVLENRCPLNFYILLAGSAVVIKEDENGNTNPVSFMKRGDVFGEREILDNQNWEFSVVTVDPCEFLLLDRQDYMRIFLAGGSGGLLNDPERGKFLRNLSLFRGWPTQLLDANPNRCLFRYYKRGALLAKDNAESDWIFVVKSGSCSVLKPMKVEELTPRQIYRKQMQEQTAKFPPRLMPRLVDRRPVLNEEDHLQRIREIEENLKADQLSLATSYKQLEMAAILKELNIDIKEGLLTPVNEEEEEDDEEKEEQAYLKNNKKEKSVTINITEGDLEPYVQSDKLDPEFRMSRVSDRAGPARTPSPMKAAYLQTGISSPRKEDSSKRNYEANDNETTVTETDKNTDITSQHNIEEIRVEETKQINPIESSSAEDFLSKLDSSSESDDEDIPPVDQGLKPVYVNVRKLTRGSSFGLGPVLFNEQPSLALISNGAECLVLNKKFYLDNMSDEVLKNLRDVEHPYPSESELHESYWRLISWKAFQQRTVQGLHLHRAKVRHYLNPPKTDVY